MEDPASPPTVAEQLQSADLTAYIGDAQGLVIAAVLVLVGFTMLRKVFGK